MKKARPKLNVRAGYIVYVYYQSTVVISSVLKYLSSDDM